MALWAYPVAARESHARGMGARRYAARRKAEGEAVKPFLILPEDPGCADVRYAASQFVGALDLQGRWKVSIAIADSKRSLEQNAKMWAMLADVSAQVKWYGKWLSDWDWKDVFTAALKKSDVVPGIDRSSFVVLGAHTSRMSIKMMGDLIELMYAFGAENDVRWTE